MANRFTTPAARLERAAENFRILSALYAGNRELPNGGPRLTVLAPNEFRDFWTVGDGAYYYGNFPSAADAIGVLRRAGFKSRRAAGEVYWHTY